MAIGAPAESFRRGMCVFRKSVGEGFARLAPAETFERGSGVFWGLWTEVVGEFPAGLNLSDGIKNKLCKGFDLINSSVLFILSTYANAGFQVLHRWFLYYRN